MDQLTERLVEYAQALSYEDLLPEVVERTKRLILDTVGCALGAAPWPAPSIARALAADVQSRTPATVMVSGQPTSPDGGALYVMLFPENLIRALLIFSELRSRHCQRALLGYHYLSMRYLGCNCPYLIGGHCSRRIPRQ